MSLSRNAGTTAGRRARSASPPVHAPRPMNGVNRSATFGSADFPAMRSGSAVGWLHTFLPVTVREARAHLVGESGQSGTHSRRPCPLRIWLGYRLCEVLL